MAGKNEFMQWTTNSINQGRMSFKGILRTKWLLYTILCVIFWIPLSLISKLGADAFKKETIISEFIARSDNCSYDNLNIGNLIKEGIISKDEVEALNIHGDAVATRLMNLLTILGSCPIAFVLFGARKFRIEKSIKGAIYGLIAGFLSIIGYVGMFFAFANAPNATLVSVSTGLFPMVTVILAVIFLHERLNWVQYVGLTFAVIAIVIFSITGS